MCKLAAAAWIGAYEIVIRRDFLRRFGFGVAGLVVGAELDLERLLWVPKPLITVPAMSDATFITPDWIMQDVAKFWVEQISLLDTYSVDRLRSSKAERLFRKQRGASSTLAGASIL